MRETSPAMIDALRAVDALGRAQSAAKVRVPYYDPPRRRVIAWALMVAWAAHEAPHRLEHCRMVLAKARREDALEGGK